MEDRLLQVKEDWNKTSDSAWYQSLRTEEKIKALVEVPEGAFHPAVENSFWFTYEELIKQDEESLKEINNWEKNPMAALPAWVTIVSKKCKVFGSLYEGLC